jgi:phosphohistidine phosphatase SixA
MFHNTKKKQIILMRHAKAVEREDWSGADFDRPLTEEGIESNQIVANYLRLIGVRPDMIVASPSIRTKMTAEIIAKKFHEKTITFKRDLYNENIV